jgi:hypothetical protein
LYICSSDSASDSVCHGINTVQLNEKTYIFKIKREGLKQIEKFHKENEKILDFIFLGLMSGVLSVRMNISY